MRDPGVQRGNNTNEFFSPDYFTARDRFRCAVTQAGGGLEELRLDARGPEGEELTVDIGWFGDAEPRRALVHSSGIHGVEGFAGSGIQLQWLDRLRPVPSGMALVMIHILNPYGMAWLRRANENNVDLNRNFRSDGYHSDSSSIYAELDSFLNPRTPPGFDWFMAKAFSRICRYGRTRVKQSVSGGQHEFPRGLFFGGKQMEAGPRKYEAFLKRRLAAVEKAIVIDVHTGLGAFGEDTLLVNSEDFTRLRPIFGERVTPLRPEGGAAYRVDGGLDSAILRMFVRRPMFIGQEFGSYGPMRVLHALREENRWHHFGDGSLTHPVKLKLKETFSPASPRWREMVLRRGCELISQSIEELGS